MTVGEAGFATKEAENWELCGSNPVEFDTSCVK